MLPLILFVVKMLKGREKGVNIYIFFYIESDNLEQVIGAKQAIKIERKPYYLHTKQDHCYGEV